MAEVIAYILYNHFCEMIVVHIVVWQGIFYAPMQNTVRYPKRQAQNKNTYNTYFMFTGYNITPVKAVSVDAWWIFLAIFS